MGFFANIPDFFAKPQKDVLDAQVCFLLKSDVSVYVYKGTCQKNPNVYEFYIVGSVIFLPDDV